MLKSSDDILEFFVKSVCDFLKFSISFFAFKLEIDKPEIGVFLIFIFEFIFFSSFN